jgi:hypothetical protein
MLSWKSSGLEGQVCQSPRPEIVNDNSLTPTTGCGWVQSVPAPPGEIGAPPSRLDRDGHHKYGGDDHRTYAGM